LVWAGGLPQNRDNQSGGDQGGALFEAHQFTGSMLVWERGWFVGNGGWDGWTVAQSWPGPPTAYYPVAI